MVLGDATAVAQAGFALVAGAGVNLRQAKTQAHDSSVVGPGGGIGRFLSGRRKGKHVPWPGADCTSIWPLWLLVMMKYDTDRPRPVPWPISLVVKNGSKVRLRTASGMPTPLSSTWISAHGGLSRVRRVMRPGSLGCGRRWMAWAAFFS